MKSVPIPQCIYSESLYQIQIAALLYILHFSPGNLSGGRVLPGIGGLGGMGEMGDLSGMGGMESGNMAQGDGKLFHDPCWCIQDPLIKLACNFKCRLLPFLCIPFCVLIG